jgi:hypothetical protein
VKLTIKVRPATVVRAESGCVVAVGGCPVIGTDTHEKEMYVQGTAYLPKAKIDLTLNNISGQVFRAGVVARAAVLNISASSTYTGPVIELPDNTLAPTPVELYFTAWQCPPATACSATPSIAGHWRVRGRAKVKFEDPNTSPVAGDRRVFVLGWQVSR